MDPPARRIVQMSDWAPVQEAMFENSSSSAANTYFPPQSDFDSVASTESRFRSMSVSLPRWPRPKSALFDDGETAERSLGLEKSRSHGFGGGSESGNSASGPSSSKHEARNLKGMLRRASVSLRSGVKGFVHRRTSVPAGAIEVRGKPQLHE